MREKGQNSEKNAKNIKIETWKPSDVNNISKLEELTWAPWLRKPAERFQTIAESYSPFQLLARKSDNEIIASLTTNRISWDGNPASLTTWDDVAGGSVGKSDYSQTFVPNGNTLCLMSMDVHPDHSGEGLASKLIEEIISVAKNNGIDHVISSFRANGYGSYKLSEIEAGRIPDFEEYCKLTTTDTTTGRTQPVDPWIRVVDNFGMVPLRVELESMVVEEPIANFERYKREYQPGKWVETKPGVWECGETGTWYVEGDIARYVEPNLWGEVPLPQTLN